MRRKRLWKQALAVTLSAAMLLGVPSEGVFAVEAEFAETTESTEETEDTESVTDDVTETEESENTTESEETQVVEEEKTATAAGNFQYEENEDGTITIKKYTGKDTNVVVPEQMNGKRVTGIGDEAFYNCSNLTGIEIPDSVTSIGAWAFGECSSLKSIEIPDGVTSIEASVFFECGSLVSVKIPDGVTSIGDSAFYECDSLKSIKIPDGVTIIKDWAFYDCRSLTSVEMSDSVTSMGGWAFGICDSLTSIEIPNGMTSIGEYAFEGCRSLTGIEIPDSVTSIGNGAFRGCSGLKSIVVGQGNTKYTSVGNNCIIEKDSNTLIRACSSTTIPNSVTSIGNYAFSICDGLVSIKIPNSVTNIGQSAFEYCSSLKSIEIPNGVKSIGQSAFEHCSSLTNIKLPDSVKNIGNYSFCHCSSLTSIKIPNSVKSIGQSAFEYCSSLTDIEIPDSVTSIGDYAFGSCSSLTIYCPDGSLAKQYAIDNKIPYKLIEDINCTHANTELRNAASATCTKAGYTGDTYCKDCGALVNKGKSIAALGHSYKATVTKQPTVNAEGVRTYTCSRCKASYTEKIAKLTVTYTIKFDGNGSTGGSMKTLSGCKYGKKYTLTKNGFKKKGYTFTGWNTKKDGSGKTYKNKAEVKNLSSKADGKVTLYAQWKKTKYTITYNLNKGKNNKNNPSSYSITTKTIKLKNPTRKGYTFKGWYSDKKCTKKVTQIKKGSTGNVTLYAKWKKK